MAYFGQLVSFTGSLRKALLIPFGLFSPNDNLGFLADAPLGTSAMVNATLTPSPDGVQTVFTITATGVTFGTSGVGIFRNGVLQKAGVNYTLSGSTITWISPFIPASDDYFQASAVTN